MIGTSRTTLLCLVLSAWVPVGASAQAARSHDVGLMVGVSSFHARDLMLSPLTYRGTNPRVQLSYSSSTALSQHTVELGTAVGDIDSTVPYHTQTGVQAQVAYGYWRRVATLGSGGSDLPLFVGGFIQSSLDGSFEQEYQNTSWMVAHSIGPRVAIRHQTDAGHRLTWDVALPAFAYVIRPPYAGFDERLEANEGKWLTLLTSGGEVAAFTEYLMVLNRLTYVRDRSGRLDLALAYEFSYQRFDRPRNVTSFGHVVSVGFWLELRR